MEVSEMALEGKGWCDRLQGWMLGEGGLVRVGKG